MIDFLLEYYLWILIVLVLIVITTIGFVADTNKKKKERTAPSSNNYTNETPTPTLTTNSSPIAPESQLNNQEPLIKDLNSISIQPLAVTPIASETTPPQTSTNSTQNLLVNPVPLSLQPPKPVTNNLFPDANLDTNISNQQFPASTTATIISSQPITSTPQPPTPTVPIFQNSPSISPAPNPTANPILPNIPLILTSPATSNPQTAPAQPSNANPINTVANQPVSINQPQTNANFTIPNPQASIYNFNNFNTPNSTPRTNPVSIQPTNNYNQTINK